MREDEAGMCGVQFGDHVPWWCSTVWAPTATADFKVNQTVMKAVSHDPAGESIHLGHGEALDGNQGWKLWDTQKHLDLDLDCIVRWNEYTFGHWCRQSSSSGLLFQQFWLALLTVLVILAVQLFGTNIGGPGLALLAFLAYSYSSSNNFSSSAVCNSVVFYHIYRALWACLLWKYMIHCRLSLHVWWLRCWRWGWWWRCPARWGKEGAAIISPSSRPKHGRAMLDSFSKIVRWEWKWRNRQWTGHQRWSSFMHLLLFASFLRDLGTSSNQYNVTVGLDTAVALRLGHSPFPGYSALGRAYE